MRPSVPTMRLLSPVSACVILDLKRVNDVDSTGAKILFNAHDRLTKEGKFLLHVFTGYGLW